MHTVIHERRDDLCLRPFSLRIEFLCKFVPATFVCRTNLRDVVLQYSLVEMNNELEFKCNRSINLLVKVREYKHEAYPLNGIGDLSEKGLLRYLLLHRSESRLCKTSMRYI